MKYKFLLILCFCLAILVACSNKDPENTVKEDEQIENLLDRDSARLDSMRKALDL